MQSTGYERPGYYPDIHRADGGTVFSGFAALIILFALFAVV